MLEFQCPHCRVVLSIPEQFIGTKGTCRKCGKPITIALGATHNLETEVGAYASRPPTLVAFHCQATGPSARKCNITELGAVKFDLNGNELDTFWTHANPGHLIPPRVSEKTGVTDEMCEHAPTSSEAVKRWFEWIGPHFILFSHHAHFDTKFVCGTLLKEDISPTPGRVVDVIEWARKMEVPVEEYKMRNLLDFVGHRVKKTHQTLETCHGIVALASYLSKRQAGAHLEVDNSSLFNKIMGKKTEAVNEDLAYQALRERSRTLEDACEEDFFEKVRYEARLKRVKSVNLASGPVAAQPVEPENGRKHPALWFEQMGKRIEQAKREAYMGGGTAVQDLPKDPRVEYLLLEASQAFDREEQKRLCREAVALGAHDPWPYDKLVSICIKTREYEEAQQIAETYFEKGVWKVAKWADTSIDLLKKLEKLEKKLAEK